MARWENSATTPVLKLLNNANVVTTPGAIHWELQQRMERPPSKATITRAINRLLERDLIERPTEDHAYYRITEKGEKYLKGETPLDEL